jgi:hypothetical protein
MSLPKPNSKIVDRQLPNISFFLACASLLGSVTPAAAIQFRFTYAPNTTFEQMVGFEMAGRIWSNYLTDDVTINIHVEMANGLPSNVVGGALTGWQAREKYEDFVEALYDDRSSANDDNAFNSLAMKRDGKKFNALVNGTQIKDLEKINLTNANAKALGLLEEDEQALDGYIVLNDLANQSTSWNYGFTNASVATDQLDFLSVATHEIGHILGFASGIDDPGWLNVINEMNDGKKIDKKKAEYFAPLDQFRYSSQSADTFNIADGQMGLPDLSVGGTKYFSLDRGRTSLGEMSTGESIALGGDGEQASHWKHQNNSIGIMAPLLHAGVRPNLSALDILAFDVIGWDVNNNASLTQEQLERFYGEAANYAQSNYFNLRFDREQEVEKMIDESEIYQWGNGSYSSSYYCGIYYPCTRVWQKYAMWQKVEIASIPESKTTAALIACSLFGMAAYGKKRQ